ncbi:MAG: hypothetical protein C0448_09455 [Sphingobacteriaceae bacterium]|nr:hypothetical protein [Sphingobacteriaceae bacterium]
MKQFIIILTFLISFTGFSQEKAELYTELKNSKLYVLMFDTTDASSNSNPLLAGYNYNIRGVFTKERWNFCPVEFVYFDKLESFLQNNGEAFLMIPLGYIFEAKNIHGNGDRTSITFQGYVETISVASRMLKIGKAKNLVFRKKIFEKNGHVDFTKDIKMASIYSFNVFSLTMSVDYLNKSFSKGLLSKEELKEMKDQEKSKPRVSNSENLKARTLLVNGKMLDGLNDELISAAFGYPIKITTYSDINEAIKNKRSNIAILQRIIINPQTGAQALVIFDNDEFKNLGFIEVKPDLEKYNKEIFEKLKKAVDKG